MKTIDCGNNESYVRGAVQQADGSWFALTSTDSKEFKTQEGARKWLARRGLGMNGERLAQ